ncbi:MAG TPA: glycoside hydrolase family 38 C-terminal domain-containing protein, partial [Candidatus Acidoferrales bacterium]|nr:glycoside hydrolase family 38 C-terminal domain-containing protein [Candidatus Acidoferrales bacterium]
ERLPDTGSVRIHMTHAGRCTVSFVADDLAQAGFSFYRLVRVDSAPVNSVARTSNSIENEFFRLMATRRGLEIRDLKRDRTMELYFEDAGDRGDEYNFDPVSTDAPIVEPVSLSARVTGDSGPRLRIEVSMVFQVPAALSDDRSSRGSATEPLAIELVGTLHAGLERVDFVAEVENRSRDHRLRAALRTPVVAADAVHDTSFGVIRRALEASEPRGTEDIYPTVPQRSFTAVEGTVFSAALMARGLLEVEVRRESAGATILLTLLRCVGWLSRSDLATRRGGAGPELETPGAQEPGAHRFEFALTTFQGSYLDGDVIARVEAYTTPPRVFRGASAGASGGLELVRCDNARVVFSTARPLARAGAYKVRAYSASPLPERARFTFGAERSARMVDLAGRAAKSQRLKRSRDGSITIEMRPFQIVTFEVRTRRTRRSGKYFSPTAKKD